MTYILIAERNERRLTVSNAETPAAAITKTFGCNADQIEHLTKSYLGRDADLLVYSGTRAALKAWIEKYMGTDYYRVHGRPAVELVGRFKIHAAAPAA